MIRVRQMVVNYRHGSDADLSDDVNALKALVRACGVGSCKRAAGH